MDKLWALDKWWAKMFTYSFIMKKNYVWNIWELPNSQSFCTNKSRFHAWVDFIKPNYIKCCEFVSLITISSPVGRNALVQCQDKWLTCQLTVVCYMLCVTCCVLHVVCYMLCVTCCVLHAVCYMLCVTCEQVLHRPTDVAVEEHDPSRSQPPAPALTGLLLESWPTLMCALLLLAL